ncbi:MAG: EamA family transporter, partial [Pseudomonadota bacterium]
SMSAAAPAKRSAARLARIWTAAPANARGAAWLFIAAMAVMVMFVGVKLIDGDLNAMQVTFLRAAAGALLLAPLYLRRDPMRLLRPKRPWAVLSRSVTATIAITLAYVSLSRLPLADAQALSFANTLFLVPIAAIFLGERVGVRRWSAAGAGFLGVLIMLRPTGAVNVGALAAVGGAFMMAITIAQVKALSR